jgi:hypothetical protein
MKLSISPAVSRSRRAFGGLCTVVALGACSGHADGVELDSLPELGARHPEILALAAEARDAVVPFEEGIRIRSGSERAGRRHSVANSNDRGVTVELLDDGTGALRVGPSDRARRVLVRRVGGTGARAAIEGRAARVRDTVPGMDAVFFAREHGVEELLVVRDPHVEVAYDFDLPAGGRLRASQGTPGLVEVCDAAGTPWLRLSVGRAWDARGPTRPPEPIVEGNRLRLALGSFQAPLIVDPEWQASRGIATPRVASTSTLLSDGRVLVAGGQSGADLESMEMYDPLKDVFSDGGKMLTARRAHTATLLTSGKVLLAGGAMGDGSPTTVIGDGEVYDPVGGRSVAILPPLAEARSNQSATLLADGRVLVTGGNGADGSQLASAELYDPATGTGTFGPTGALSVPRVYHTATRLFDGRVLVLGGYGTDVSPLASAEIYDPGVGGGTFMAMPALKEGRRYHGAVLLPSGKVLVVGGEGHGLTTLASAELYDPAAKTTTSTGSLAIARTNASVVLLPDGTVLVAGGKDVNHLPVAQAERYDPAIGAFAPAGEPVFDALGIATLLPSGKVLFVGDFVDLFEPAPADLTSVPSGSMAATRGGHTATLLGDGQVLVAGGITEPTPAPAELYDPTSGTFSPAGSLVEDRQDHAAVRLMDGRVLLLGGSLPGGLSVASAEIYDPAVHAFSAVKNKMNVPRCCLGATLLPDGRVLVAGGSNNGLHGELATPVSLASAEMFDPKTNTFTSVGSMAVARQSFSPTLLPTGEVLVSGGVQLIKGGSTVCLGSAEVFDPASGQFSGPVTMAFPHCGRPTALTDGTILISDGYGAELYDPATRQFHTPTFPAQIGTATAATLLPSGKVLFLGGLAGLGADSALPHMPLPPWVFDPVTQRIRPAGAPAPQTYWHSATLLPNGKVLVAGGFSWTGPSGWKLQSGTQLWSEPTVGNDAWRPVVGSVASPVIPGAAISISGSGFTGISNANELSPTNHPVALWMPVAGVPMVGRLAPWSGAAATWTPPSTPYPGLGLLFVTVNGIRSAGRLVQVERAGSGVPCVGPGACASGHCASGVCCDSACDGLCETCRAAAKGGGVDGECGPVAAGTPPDTPSACTATAPETCGTTGFCDGSGNCALHLDGTPCGPGTCRAGRCVGTACSSNLDCVVGYVCSAARSCVPVPQDGAPGGGCSAARSLDARPRTLGALFGLAAVLAIIGRWRHLSRFRG